MTLTHGEKLILLMLSEIHTKLGITGGINGRFIGEAVMTGNTWAIDREYRGSLLATEDIAESVVDEVTDFLQMWGIIEDSYASLSEDDKLKVKAEASFSGDTPRFRGFDFNREGDHLSVAQFYTEQTDGFRSFKGRINDTHSPTLERYRHMYWRLKQIPAESRGRLNVEQLVDVLNRKDYENHVQAHDMDL